MIPEASSETLLQRIGLFVGPSLLRQVDMLLAVGVAVLVGTLILPLPSGLIDALLALNLSLSAVILVAVLLSPKPLAISTFPTLLLITTLFRLALNVSTTRMILATGSAGEVVRAFGQFVLRGDVVVGMVIFLVITVVQLLVIGKGAERVAEVGARFTLDAMPGKQMSIDAALRSGAITDEEAQEKRQELGRESQFYGAMDGAMKFIKGDAIAGLVITALNLVAGLAIGVMRLDMPVGEAAEVYSVLTVGDGLVSQIPALLITLSAGLLSTRVASRQPEQGLAESMQNELLSSPKVLGVGAGFALALGLIPGLPLIPFLVISLSLALLALWLQRENLALEAGYPAAMGTALHALEHTLQTRAQVPTRSLLDEMLPSVPLLGIDLDPRLTEALGFGPGKKDAQTELLGQLVPQLRDAIYLETGVKLPGVRVRSNTPELPPGGCVIRLKDIPMRELQVASDRLLAIESPERLQRLGVCAEAADHPMRGLSASWVAFEDRPLLESAGVSTWTPSGVVALELAQLARSRLKDFVGLHETQEILDRMEEAYPALVKAVIPKLLSTGQLSEILRRLIDEAVSIRDMKSILEAIAEFGQSETSSVELTELVRSALSLQLAYVHAGLGQSISVLLLDAVIEDTIESSIHVADGARYLAIEPELRDQMLLKIARALQPVFKEGLRPVILTRAEIRRYVRKLVEERLPEISVLSYQELPPQLMVHPLGRVVIGDDD